MCDVLITWHDMNKSTVCNIYLTRGLAFLLLRVIRRCCCVGIMSSVPSSSGPGWNRGVTSRDGGISWWLEAGGSGSEVMRSLGIAGGGKVALSATSAWLRRSTRSAISEAPWSRLELDGSSAWTLADSECLQMWLSYHTRSWLRWLGRREMIVCLYIVSRLKER